MNLAWRNPSSQSVTLCSLTAANSPREQYTRRATTYNRVASIGWNRSFLATVSRDWMAKYRGTRPIKYTLSLHKLVLSYYNYFRASFIIPQLSYQKIQTDERATPILPRSRNMMGDGPMQSETTSRCDFAPKSSATRPDPIIPSSNLKSADTPMDDTTTARLSYAVPGPMDCVQSYKPVVHYAKSPYKIDCETVSKLSYQTWTPPPKEELTWAVKRKYEPPKDPMCADTIYQASYPAPGHYEQLCEEQQDCDCLDVKETCPSAQTEPCENSNDSHR
nr:uncharacterized protein LOC117219624 isoform X1 [Megalopta genalis]